LLFTEINQALGCSVRKDYVKDSGQTGHGFISQAIVKRVFLVLNITA